MVQSVKNPHAMQKTSCNAADLVSIPGLGRYPGEGNDNPLRYSCLADLEHEALHRLLVSSARWSFARSKMK